MAVTMHFRILHFAFRKKSEGDGVARGGNKKVTTSAMCGCVSGCVFGCAADSECVISYELCGESAENLEVFRALFLFFFLGYSNVLHIYENNCGFYFSIFFPLCLLSTAVPYLFNAIYLYL